MNIQIFYKSTDDIELNDQLLSRLSPHRKKQLASLRFDADKKLCAAAGLLLWEHVYMRSPEKYTVLFNRFKKPCIPGAPFFNISHSGELAMLAVADVPVGCDIEHPRRPVLSRHVFHENELKMLQSLPDNAQKEALFLRLWTAKEAFFKAVGTGIQQDAADYDLTAGICTYSDGTRWKLHCRDVPEFGGYAACVCFMQSENEEPL